MASEAKSPSPTDINLAAIVDGQTIDAGDVTTAFDDVATEIDSARTQVSVTENDTHVKNLNDALVVSTPVEKETVNATANEQLRIKLSTKLTTFETNLANDGDVPYTEIDTTGLTAGQPIVADGSGGINTIPASSGTSPVDIEGVAGEALSERDIVFLASDGEWYKIDIDATPILCGQWRGVVEESGGISNGATGTIRLVGEVSGFTGLTPWAPVYASDTAGGYTQTKPTLSAGGAQKAIVTVGIATGTTSILVNTPAFKVEYAKRASLTNTATLTLDHHSDALARNRNVSAYVSGTDAGAVIEEYDSVNSNANVQLEGQAGAGGTTTITASGAPGAIGNASGTNYWLAQGFQVTGGRLSQFTYNAGANNGTPSGTVTWEIREDNGGQPTGTILQSGTFVPTASSVNTINISDGPFLLPLTTYWLVLRPTSAQSSNNYWVWTGSTSSTYASGQLLTSTNNGTSYSLLTGVFEEGACSITTSAVVDNDKLAQSFQISAPSDVKTVKLWLKKTGSPTGTLTLRIETNNAGSPSGTLVDANATTTLAESSLGTSYALATFTFANSFSLSSATTYWIVLSTSRAASNANFVEWGADSTPAYANGEMRRERSATWSAESKDAVFQILAPDTTYHGPIAVDFWTFTNVSVVCRFDDGAGANGDTKTTFMNRSGSTLDMTIIVEMN